MASNHELDTTIHELSTKLDAARKNRPAILFLDEYMVDKIISNLRDLRDLQLKAAKT